MRAGLPHRSARHRSGTPGENELVSRIPLLRSTPTSPGRRSSSTATRQSPAVVLCSWWASPSNVQIAPKLPVLRLPGLMDQQDARWGLYEAAMVGRDDGMYAVAQVELGEYVTDVTF